MEFKHIILDADSLLYICSITAEKEEASHACQNMKSKIQKIKDYLRCDSMEIFIKGEGNFRDAMSTSTVYKGTRPTLRPRHLDAVTDYIVNKHGAQRADGMEADDLCSVLLHESHGFESGVVLASVDKDLWNTPGWHFNYDQRKWNAEYITVQEANRNFIRQIVTGDAIDNIPGLPKLAEITRTNLGMRRCRGAGKACANAIIRGLSNRAALEAVWVAYCEYGAEQGWPQEETKAYFLEQGRLLWMTRELEVDGSPKLWSPPSYCSFWDKPEALPV